MKRYLLAGVIQGLLASLACVFLALTAEELLTERPVGSSSVPFFALVAVASILTAVFGLLAWRKPGFRFAFTIAELLWTFIYAWPVIDNLIETMTQDLSAINQVDEPLVRLTLVLATAASQAGSAAAGRILACLLLPHAICLVLGLWGLIEGRHNMRRRQPALHA